MEDLSTKPIKRKGSDKGAERSSKVPRTAPDPIRVSSTEDRNNSKSHKTDSPRVADERRGSVDDRSSEESVLRDKVCEQFSQSFCFSIRSATRFERIGFWNMILPPNFFCFEINVFLSLRGKRTGSGTSEVESKLVIAMNCLDASQVQKYLADALCTGESTGTIKYALLAATCLTFLPSAFLTAQCLSSSDLHYLFLIRIAGRAPFRCSRLTPFCHAGTRRARSESASSHASTTFMVTAPPSLEHS